MTNISQLIRVGEQALDLQSALPWLEGLAQLGDHWQELAQALRTLPDGGTIDSVDSLFSFIRGKLDNPAVVTAFNTLHLPNLRDQLKKVEDAFANLPEPVKKLAAPLSNFVETAVPLDSKAAQPLGFREDWVDGADPGEISLPLSLFDVTAAGSEGDLDVTLEADAAVGLACEAGALWPYSRDAVPPGLLQITLNGSFNAKAGASLPFQHGKLTAGAEAGVSGALMVFARPANSGTIYAAALARVLPALPNPLDLASLWSAMALGSIEGQIIAIDGHASANVAVALGKSIDLPKVLTGELAITATLSVKAKAAYVLSLRRDGSAALGNQSLLVALSRDRSSVRQLGAGVGLTLDLSPLFERVHALLEDAVKQWDSTLKTLRPYLKPGQWVHDNLSSEIKQLTDKWVKDDALRTALTQDLGLLLGGSGADSLALQDRLTEKISEQLNSVAGLASGAVETKAKAAIETIVDWLPSVAQDKVRSELEAGLADWIGRYQSALDQEINAIAGHANGKAVKKAVESVGIEVQSKLDLLDERTAALRQIVDRYDTLVHDIVTFTGDSAKQKIAAELSFSETRESGLDLEVVGRFTRAKEGSVTPEAASLYAAMVRGQLAPLQKLFDDGVTVPGFDLDKDRSSIRRFSKVSRKVGFTFVGFGLELSASQLLSAEASVTCLANGDVAVLASSEMSKDSQGPREGRSATFVSSYDLLLAKAQAGSSGERRALTLGITASHRDKSLKVEEVQGFLGALSARQLVSKSRVDKALEIYQSWNLTNGSNAKHPRGDLVIDFQLDRPALDRLLNLGRTLRAELAPNGPSDQSLIVMGVAFDAMMAVERVDAKLLDRQIKDLRSDDRHGIDKSVPNRLWLLHVLQAYRRIAGQEVKDHRDRTQNAIVLNKQVEREIAIMTDAVNALADMLQLIAEIYDATPQSKDNPNGWDEKHYRKQEALLAQTARYWLSLGSEFIFWFKQGLGNRTAAFFTVLISLATGITPDKLTPDLADRYFALSLTPRGADGKAGKTEKV